MKRLLYVINPNWASQYMSRDPIEKAWKCATCGTVPPFALLGGWYIRRRCQCEQDAEERRQRDATPRTLAQALAVAQLEQVYTWLGRSWVDSQDIQKLEACTFASFDRALQIEGYNQARKFTITPNGVLVFFGTFGLGKTHLLAAIANAHRTAGRACLYASAVTLFSAMQGRLDQGKDSHDLLHRALSTPMLLLDDIDKPKPSDFRQQVYYQIIDGRTRRGLPLAISSNEDPAKLEPYIGGAARSRLMMDLTPVPFTGMDYRLKGKR